MRILRFLITSFVFIAVVAGVAFLIGREVLLLLGTSTVQSTLSEMSFISRNGSNYIAACRAKGTPIDVPAISGLQIRFVDSSTYVEELLCSQFESDPIVIRTVHLPFLVHKLPGSAGIIWGKDRSAIVVGVLGRQASVGVEDRQIVNGGGDTLLGTSPLSSCQGYGYMCCQNETLSGVGNVYSAVTDCPRSCYPMCAPRPVVLSFSSDPFPDQNRVVTTQPGQSVTFSFVASYTQKLPTITTIDFGDQKTQDFPDLTDSAIHIYQCPTTRCVYVAKMKTTVTTKSGTIESAATPVTQLTIVVQP